MHEKEEQYRLLTEAAKGSEAAREELVRNNLGLVKSIACRFSCSGYEWEDLVQVGCIGLVKAIERFDTAFDVMFSTYAMPLILGEIKRYIRDDGRIKFSRELKSGIVRLKNSRERLSKELGRSPKLSEIAEAMDTDRDSILNLMEAERTMYNIGSLDDPEGGDRAERDSRIICGEEEQIDRIMLKSMIETLPPRERQIIILRYYKDMTQSEIARIMGISQVHVSRLEKKILAKMGAALSRDEENTEK
ncbi:MAG: SigB/SigF/SigG family RNA polymerase sigma factor [Bacillota bacterium]|nr:SigB/SigF/SigG family RNA polymerase sigma factor [Bacillota bacterium]